ncbi:MAG: ACT domain-containing protein [Desulfovibrio sp.]|jgi:hypothetical protein|nr:ACT domain-containing protein [Desulfovibrio sp.]MBQ3893318.1 ACT domain-containing protein [Mailhella sp.]
MTIEQISVFVQNRSGQLGAVTDALRKAGVSIRAMSLADTADFGVFRIIADNAASAKAALQDAGFTVGSTPVLAVEVPDRSGGLGDVLELFSSHGLNVEYLYGFSRIPAASATLIFRMDRMNEAESLLAGNGIRILGQEDLA